MATLSAEEKLTGLAAELKEVGQRLGEIDGMLKVAAVAASGEDPWLIREYQLANIDLAMALYGILNDLREVRDKVDWPRIKPDGE